MSDGTGLLFAVSGGSEAGLGHVMRAAEIAREAQARGRPVAFALRGDSAAHAVLQRELPNTIVGPWQTPSDVANPRASWVIFDTRDAIADDLRSARESGARVLVLDRLDWVDSADLNVMPVLHAPPVEHPRVKSGGEYCIVAAALRARESDALSATRDRILVSLGGADPLGLTERVAEHLDTVPEGGMRPRVLCVLGPAFRDAGRRREALERRGWEVAGPLTRLEFARALERARFAVVGFGTSVYELAHRGVPMLYVTHHSSDCEAAAYLERLGVGALGSDGPHFDDLAFAAAFKRTALDPSWCARSARRGRELVGDGLGAARILDALETAPPLRPAVICLAAGATQVPVIEAIRARGLAVVAVDRAADAPGFAASDEALVQSTHDPLAIREALAPLSGRYRWVGVVNRSSGPPVVTAAELSRILALPGVDPEVARTLVDKSRLMARCAHAGLPAPRCHSVRAFDEIDVDALEFPCVVKPSLSLVGKLGVARVDSAAQLAGAFARALAASQTGVVNVESWSPGRDVSLISIVRGGTLHPIALIDELNVVAGDGTVRALGVAAPSALAGGVEEQRILALARRLIAHFELDTTPFMLACRCEPGGSPRITEIHLDLGGDLIFDALLPEAGYAGALDSAIALLTGRDEVSSPPILRAVAVLFDSDRTRFPRRHRSLCATDRGTLEARIDKERSPRAQGALSRL